MYLFYQTIIISIIVLLEATQDNGYDTFTRTASTIAMVVIVGLYLALPVFLGLAGTNLAVFYIMSFASILLIGISVLGLILDSQSPNNGTIQLAAQITSGFAIAVSSVGLIYCPIYVKRAAQGK